MLVGIIDIDLFINKKTFLPNPEVMLYSAYHKQNKDIVHLLMDGKNIDIYEKIYIFRNRSGKVKFPEELYSRNNVICRGQYFTNGVIAPIPPEVFACEPDKFIYDKYCKYWGDKPIKGVTTLSRAKYVSLRKGFSLLTGAGTNNLYDYDLGAQGDYEKLLSLYNKGYFKKLHSYYPIQCTDIEETIKWATSDFLTSLTKLFYTKPMTWDEICRLRKYKFRIPIRTYLTDKYRFANQKELDNLIIQALDKVLYCIINQVDVEFKLNPKIRITEQFTILKRICDWSSAPQQPSFYTFCTRKEQELVDRFLQDNPSVKDWVYLNPHEYRIKGGIWLNDRRTN